MAGTMPHAIFIETNADGAGGVAAYAAEVPGCAVFAPTDEEAASAMPARVQRFLAWLAERGEPAPPVVGDNWYEVERAAPDPTGEHLRRDAFSLDELSPSDEEFARWLLWLELAREELAGALDQAPDGAADGALLVIADQDIAFVGELGGEVGERWTAAADPTDRLYAARDALTDALVAAGPAADGARRILRIAIADDLRLAERLGHGQSGGES